MNWEAELTKIKEAGLYRQLRSIDAVNSEGRVIVDGQEMLMFASNNYLGLAFDQRLIAAANEATERFGTGSTGSRLTTGNTILHQQLEQQLATFKRTEAALLFNTGYMANVAALTALVDHRDVILSDEMNHASIIDGCRLSRATTLVYQHSDLDDLERKLCQTGHYRRKLIVTDGVFSMDGDIAPLPKIVELARRYDALVMVDDAHATGVLGAGGRGTAEHFGLCGQIDIQMGTLSKAVGAEGGYIAGTASLINYLLNRARPFIFSTALPAGVIGAAMTALNIIERESEQRQRLLRLSRYVYQELSTLGFEVLGGDTPILALLCGQADVAVQFARELEANGIFAPAIRPPTVSDGTSRIRLTIMAAHQDEDIAYVIEVLARVGKQIGVISKG